MDLRATDFFTNKNFRQGPGFAVGIHGQLVVFGGKDDSGAFQTAASSRDSHATL